MEKFSDKLKVVFFVNEKVIKQDIDNKFTKLEADSSLYLDLNNIKDSNILKMLLETNKIELQNSTYIIAERTFMIDGTALYISLQK